MVATGTAWFLRVSLASLLVGAASIGASAFQAQGPPAAGGGQAPAQPGVQEEAVPPQGAEAPSRPPDVAPPAAGNVPYPSTRAGAGQQTYSTAWPYADLTPTRGSGAGNYLPTPPTARVGADRYPSPVQARGGGVPFMSQAAATAMAGRTPRSTASTRPFSSYSRPRGGVSPYMNLFRATNDVGTIDNYSTMVGPQLEQRRTNRRNQMDLRRLQTTSGAQRTQIRDLNRRTSVLQPDLGQPRFGSYFDYYPALNR